MAWNYYVIDPATGKFKIGPAATGVGALFAVQKETVSAEEGKQNFLVSAREITASTLIKVFINGRIVDETDDYVVNIENQRIEFVYIVPQNAKVRIEVY